MHEPRLDRADRWAAFGVFAAAPVVGAAAMLAMPVWRWATDRPLRVALDARAAGARDAVPGERVLVEVPGAGAVERVLDLLPGLFGVVALTVGAWLAVAVLRDVLRDRPFVEASARRLWLLAGVLVVAPVVLAYARMAAEQVVLHRLDLSQVGSGVEIPVWGLVSGLACAALAQAFAMGARLRRDAEGLV